MTGCYIGKVRPKKPNLVILGDVSLQVDKPAGLVIQRATQIEDVKHAIVIVRHSDESITWSSSSTAFDKNVMLLKCVEHVMLRRSLGLE